MKNVSEMRVELSEIFEGLKKNDLDVKQAKAMVAATNSMLKSALLEMEHSKMIGSSKEIKFLKTE
jgi:hypothetical protein